MAEFARLKGAVFPAVEFQSIHFWMACGMTCGVDQSKVHGRGFIRGGYQGPTVQLQRPFLAASNWIELIEQFAHQLWRPAVGLLECVGFCGMHLA
ncbi:MAG: hypothetical protein ACK5BY_04635 [Limnohabitans sp.]|uniref:hypothetical protein n=1 Tax=Limnohabitans sp. TaxID=1907725 RepID=UPI003918C4A5